MARFVVEQNFDIFSKLSTDHLDDVLKNEVGLVQGRRLGKTRHRHGIDADLKDTRTSNENRGGGDENTDTKVIKMNCRPLNQWCPFGSSILPPPQEEDDELNQMKMCFKGYCAQNGINIFPREEPPVRQHARDKDGGASEGRSRIRLTVTSGRKGTQTTHDISEGGGTGASGGTGGGGRRPPKRPAPSSHRNSDEESQSETTLSEPSTSTSSSSIRPKSVSPAKGKKKRRKKLKSPSESSSKKSSKKSKKSRLTISSSSTATINIRTFGVTGKKLKPIKMKKSPRQKNPFGRLPKPTTPSVLKLQPPAPPKKKHPGGISITEIKGKGKLKTGAFKINIPLSFGRGAWRAGQLDSPESSSSLPEQQQKKMGMKSYLRQRSVISNIGDVLLDMKNERDHEWLDWTSSEDSFDEDEEHQFDVKQRRKSHARIQHIQQDLRLFIESVKILDQVNEYLGLNPYKKVPRGNDCVEVKWEPKSWEFIGVCANSIFFFMTALSIFWTLIIIFGYEAGENSTTHKILKLEFANHFTEALFMLVLSMFLCLWSISCVMELGVHYAEFFSRFNLGLRTLKYDVTEGVHEMIVRQLKAVGWFLGCVAFFFFVGRNKIEIVREMCGFIGFCMLRPFSYTLRESVWVPFAEVFGLLVFSYCFFCLNVVLLQFLVYAKALGNMAKRWNLRLAYALGKISERVDDGEFVRMKKVIPVKKLHAEHLVLVSLFRNLGHVNGVVFSAFVFCVSLEIVLVIFLLFFLFTSPTVAPSPTNYVFGVGEVDLPVPLRIHPLKGEEIFKVLVFFALTMCAFWLFGGVLHVASDNLHIGIEYIRRHGLILCKSSKERRFILSMMNSYIPKHTYWIGSGFHFNREFLVGLIAFVIGVSMVTVTFSPDRTALTQITACTADGKCTLTFISSGAVDLAYEVPGVATAVKPPPPPTTEATTTPSTTTQVVELEDKYHGDFRFYTPCSSFSIYPVAESQSICNNGKWPTLTELIYPAIYKPVSFSGHKLYGLVVDPFGSDHGIVPEHCRNEKQKDYNFDYNLTFGEPTAGPIADCYYKPLLIPDFDDCGNPPFKTTVKSQGVEPVVHAVFSRNLPGVTKEEAIICCYEYPGVSRGREQGMVCNMPNVEIFQDVCKFGRDRARMVRWPRIGHLYGRILLKMLYEKVEKNNPAFYMMNEAVIKECLCRIKDPQIELDSAENCACTGMAILPCKYPTYFQKAAVEDHAMKCGPVRVPVLFKTDGNDLVFRAEHTRYRAHCVEEEFSDPFEHTDALTYGNPCGTGGGTLNLVDCAGKPVVLLETDKDDCNNWRIETPVTDDSSGSLTLSMMVPSLKIRILSYSRATKMIISEDSIWDEKAVLCCFEYAGQAFQTPDQNNFCNAPTAEAMNDEGWCKIVADNNGRRNPGSFIDAEKYNQLHDKFPLMVEYHRRKGNPNWLDDPVIGETWMKCMCTNKIPGLGAAHFETARLACLRSVVSHKELAAVNDDSFFDPYPRCKHDWPTFPDSTLITYHAVFTLKDGIWDMPHRFQKTGDPSTTSRCYMSPSSEERFTNDGLGSILDFDLNPITSTERDDCMLHPIPAKNEEDKPLHKPAEQIYSESSMFKFDRGAIELQNSEWVHCCYDYGRLSNRGVSQRWVCNLPSAAAVMDACRRRPRTPQGIRHEKEYVRLLNFYNSDAFFKGNKVFKLEELSWGSNQYGYWKNCLCALKKSHYNCLKMYLPPCIQPRGDINQDIVKLEETFTNCPSSWGPSSIRLPIVMEYVSDRELTTVFRVVQLFKEGRNAVNCPSGATVSNLGGRSNLADCYGQESPPKLDDCQLPYAATPLLSDFRKERKLPEVQLIAVNRMPGGGGDERFFCCYNYAIAENTQQVEICNMPSLAVLNRQCKFSAEQDGYFNRAANKLRQERKSGNDVLTFSFDAQKRKKWTDCICNRNRDSCQ